MLIIFFCLSQGGSWDNSQTLEVDDDAAHRVSVQFFFFQTSLKSQIL